MPSIDGGLVLIETCVRASGVGVLLASGFQLRPAEFGARGCREVSFQVTCHLALSAPDLTRVAARGKVGANKQSEVQQEQRQQQQAVAQQRPHADAHTHQRVTHTLNGHEADQRRRRLRLCPAPVAGALAIGASGSECWDAQGREQPQRSAIGPRRLSMHTCEQRSFVGSRLRRLVAATSVTEFNAAYNRKGSSRSQSGHRACEQEMGAPLCVGRGQLLNMPGNQDCRASGQRALVGGQTA